MTRDVLICFANDPLKRGDLIHVCEIGNRPAQIQRLDFLGYGVVAFLLVMALVITTLNLQVVR